MRCTKCPIPAGAECSASLCHMAGRPEWDHHIRLRAGQEALPRVPDPRLAKVRACPHRGSVLPVSQQGDGCCGSPELSECRAGHGETPGRVSLANCLECVTEGRGRGVPSGPDAYIAPMRDTDAVALPIERPWEGRIARKPWEYRVTAAIVNLDTPDLLAAVVETLRAQTLRPYILVYDAGSIGANRKAIEEWAAGQEDVELCMHRPLAWRWTSEPVAVGMDWAFARCQTDLLYATHTDVFLKRPDYLEFLAARCDAATPVVGYQMSDRSFIPDAVGQWEKIASHTATMYHMPTMWTLGAQWSMRRAFELLGIPPGANASAWPDTETCLGLILERAGIGHRCPHDPEPSPGERSQLFLGPEPNHPYETEWLIHERSYTGQSMYSAQAKAARKAKVRAEAAAAIERARGWAAARN